MKVYRVDSDKTAPVPVECEVFEYGQKDADGRTITDMSHSAFEAKAWAILIELLKSKYSTAKRAVSEARAALLTAEGYMDAAVDQLFAAEENNRHWQQEQGEG